MRAISLWQPWATLWVRGIKIHETRHWPTFVRGTVAVHAAKRKNWAERDLTNCTHFRTLLGCAYDELPFGAIVGTVDIVACTHVEDVYTDAIFKDISIEGPHPAVPIDWYLGNYEPGRFAWKAERPIQLLEPIPYRGAQGFFDIPPIEGLHESGVNLFA